MSLQEGRDVRRELSIMFGLKPLIKETYEYITSKVSKNESIATTKIIG
jgi:hypothetical protein